MATENTREKERQAAVRKAKKSKKMRRRKRMIAISIIAVLMVAITIVTLSLTVFFNIKTISVAGSNKYSAEQIMDSAEVKLDYLKPHVVILLNFLTFYKINYCFCTNLL